MSEELRVTVKKGEGYTVVYTEGYISDTQGEKVVEVCDGLMQEGYRHFILNLGKSRMISSIGIAILMEVIERAGELDGSVSFCDLTPTIAKTFEIMRLTDMSRMYADEEEAIGALVS